MDGQIVSEQQARFIRNFIMARIDEHEQAGSSSEDEGEGDCMEGGTKAGSMELAQQTLRGIAAHSAEEGKIGLGRHAQ